MSITDSASLVTTTVSVPVSDLGPVTCPAMSWNPEVHDLYGDADAILSKIDVLTMGLEDRRVYALLIESADRAEVRFFEHVNADNWAVLAWQGSSLGDMHDALARRMLDNAGVHCVGEQIKALITSRVAVELHGVVPAPASPRAAFAHSLRAHGANTFMRASIALMC